jgi:hypothetical protein
MLADGIWNEGCQRLMRLWRRKNERGMRDSKCSGGEIATMQEWCKRLLNKETEIIVARLARYEEMPKTERIGRISEQRKCDGKCNLGKRESGSIEINQYMQ